MKFFAFLLAMICLLEATAFPACISEQEKKVISSPTIAKADSCCKDNEQSCSSKKKTEDDSCDAVCSPFQLCGCCKMSLVAMVGLTFQYYALVIETLPARESLLYLKLPDIQLSKIHPPPKVVA